MSGILGTILQTVEHSTETYKFPEEVTATADGSSSSYVFQPVSNIIKSVDFGFNPNLSTLGKYTFYKCSKLESVDLSRCEKLTEIKEYCFSYCSVLSQIIFCRNGSLTSIYGYCFQSTALITIFFPKSFYNFYGDYSFQNCKKLNEVVFDPETKINKLGTFSFYGSNLSKFIIPASVTSFGWGSLFGSKIAAYELDENNKAFSVFEGNLYSKNFSIFYAVAPLATSVVFHSACSSLHQSSFMWTDVKSIVIPEHVYDLIGNVFYFAADILSIEIKNATLIPERAFEVTKKLQSLILPPMLVKIGSSALYLSGLQKVTIPASVTILDGAFSGCNPNIVVTFEEGSPHKFEDGFLYNNKSTRIYGYFGSKTELNIKESVTVIDGSSFSGSSITSIILSPNLRELGDFCFQNTKSLFSIELPKSLTLIASYCFSGSAIRSITIPGSAEVKLFGFQYSSLESVTIEEGVKSLPHFCFNGCLNLNRVSIASSVTLIDSGCFSSCPKLSSVEFLPNDSQNAALQINNEAFIDSGITQLVLPPQTASVLPSAFSRTSLVSVDAGKTKLASIQISAFKDCKSLRLFLFPKTIKTLESSCFEGCAFTTFSIPGSVESLGPKAVGNNLALRTVNIGEDSKLKAIVGTSFRGCVKLREIVCFGETSGFEVIGGVLCYKETKELCIYPPAAFLDSENLSSGKHYEVPNEIRSIGQSAFLDSRLETIVLHKDVTRIGDMAFDGCESLRFIDIQSDNIEVTIFSFSGITMRCGMIKCSKDAREILIKESKVPRFAVEDCVTYDIRKDVQYQFGFLMNVIRGEDERE